MKPPRCIECLQWRQQKGRAWWNGYCALTGQDIFYRTKCQLPEWQAQK